MATTNNNAPMHPHVLMLKAIVSSSLTPNMTITFPRLFMWETMVLLANNGCTLRRTQPTKQHRSVGWGNKTWHTYISTATTKTSTHTTYPFNIILNIDSDKHAKQATRRNNPMLMDDGATTPTMSAVDTHRVGRKGNNVNQYETIVNAVCLVNTTDGKKNNNKHK